MNWLRSAGALNLLCAFLMMICFSTSAIADVFCNCKNGKDDKVRNLTREGSIFVTSSVGKIYLALSKIERAKEENSRKLFAEGQKKARESISDIQDAIRKFKRAVRRLDELQSRNMPYDLLEHLKTFDYKKAEEKLFPKLKEPPPLWLKVVSIAKETGPKGLFIEATTRLQKIKTKIKSFFDNRTFRAYTVFKWMDISRELDFHLRYGRYVSIICSK